MMRRLLIGFFSATLGVLAHIALSPDPAQAALFCSQLSGCGGGGGCMTYASVSGCTLTCVEGAEVECTTG